jgi:hypothetical protein
MLHKRYMYTRTCAYLCDGVGQLLLDELVAGQRLAKLLPMKRA